MCTSSLKEYESIAILLYVASVENDSEHPVGESLVQYASEQNSTGENRW
jgi:cation transport ATPase